MPKTITLPAFVGDSLREAFTNLQWNMDESVNAFSAIKVALNRGTSTALMVWGDSTVNDSGASGSVREWPFLLADRIAAEYPTHSVSIVPWDAANSVWLSPVVISTGTTSATFVVWNFSVAGTSTNYGLGSLFLTALRSVPVDGMIISHGHNHVTGNTVALVRGEFLSAVETYRLYHPNVPISAVVQNPRQDSTVMDIAVTAWKDVSALRDVPLINVHDEFIAAGKPTSLYVTADTTHPNAAGQAIWISCVWEHFTKTKLERGRNPISLFAVPSPPDVNLVANGNFAGYPTSPGAPTGWAASGSGTLTMSKELVVVPDNRQGYSVKLLGTGNSSRMDYALPTPTVQALRGKPVTLSVRRYVDETSASSVGRIQIMAQSTAQGQVFDSNRAYVTKQTGWVWWVLSGFIVPADATSLIVRLNHDTAASPSANPAYFDQVCLMPGYLPRSAR